jgi:hypothetical protein
MFEVQCRWIVAVESGQAILPTKSEMWEDIRQRNAYVARRFPPGRRHAVEIEPTLYAKEMERETRLGIARRRKLAGRKGGVPRELVDNRAVESRIPANRTSEPGDVPNMVLAGAAR